MAIRGPTGAMMLPSGPEVLSRKKSLSALPKPITSSVTYFFENACKLFIFCGVDFQSAAGFNRRESIMEPQTFSDCVNYRSGLKPAAG